VASLTALCLILFFLLMKLLNLITIVELRFVNFFILLIGIRYMLLAGERKATAGWNTWRHDARIYGLL
jgi:hypothetical protein